MTLACTPYDSDNQALLTRPESNSQAGLAPLLLTVVELVRQLLEA
ncbi:MAG: gas vesicle protein GvpK, partial [Microcystis sp. M49629_WE12]|nr:gas vesicle protein GvpK [Microcystis sp. M49629_WE12]